MQDGIQHAMHDPKAAAATAAGTILTSIASLADWLPDALAIVATVLGIVLTSVLIWSHIVKTRAELKRIEAEHRLLERKHDKLDSL